MVFTLHSIDFKISLTKNKLHLDNIIVKSLLYYVITFFVANHVYVITHVALVLLLFVAWQAPLGVHSAKRSHQSPEFIWCSNEDV